MTIQDKLSLQTKLLYMNWREDKPTAKQLRTIQNMRSGWNISDKNLKRTPKTKGEAADMIGKLKKSIEATLDEQALERQEMGDMEANLLLQNKEH